MRAAAKLAITKPPKFGFLSVSKLASRKQHELASIPGRASGFTVVPIRDAGKLTRPQFGFLSATLLAVAILSVTLASCEPVAAQGLATFAQQSTPRPHAAMSFASLASIGATFSVTSASPMYHQENSADEFAFRTANYPAPNFGALLPLQETKTSFITELRVPLAQFYGSRLGLSFFVLTIQNGNMTLGPLATVQGLHSPSQPRSVNLYGVGLSIPLAKEARPEISKNLWTAFHHFLLDR